MTDQKTCFKCNRTLPIQEFYKNCNMADGRLNKCKDCAKHDMNRYYQENRVAFSDYRKRTACTPNGKATIARRNKRRRLMHPDKAKANQMVGNAIRDGKLIRQPCQVCGTTVKIEAHHTDYSKPLDVQWLCFKHHRELHGHAILPRNET